jgi:hypothetical protein
MDPRGKKRYQVKVATKEGKDTLGKIGLTEKN